MEAVQSLEGDAESTTMYRTIDSGYVPNNSETALQSVREGDRKPLHFCFCLSGNEFLYLSVCILFVHFVLLYKFFFDS